MTLDERLKDAGVDTLEELETQIRNNAEAEALKKSDKLKTQLTDLEGIKASQGNEIGDLRKEKESMEDKLKQFEESKQTKNAEEEDRKPEEKAGEAAAKVDAYWEQENAAREQAFSDKDWSKVDKALKDAPAEVKALATASEEGRAAFYAKTLGSGEEDQQETFRRPQQKAKLSIAEQIAQGLEKANGSTRVPGRRPSGVGAPSNQEGDKTRPEVSYMLVNSPSLMDRITALKETSGQ